MKLLVLLSFCSLFVCSACAQSLSWLHGDWTGETFFPSGPITKRIIVKLRVTNVTGNRFEALLDNLYPNDTTVRLERKITGHIINKTMKIESSEQTYIRDPRTQNFWRDCTGCDIQSGFSIDNDRIAITLKTTSCSDECNGETTFSRDTSGLSNTQQKDLAKWFHFPALKPQKKILPDSAGMALQKALRTADATHKTVIVSNIQNNSQKQQPIESNVKALPPNHSVPSSLKTDSTASIRKTPATASIPVSKKDTIAVLASVAVRAKDSLSKLNIPKIDTMPEALTTRTTNLITTFQVSSPHIVVQLFDNAEIDGDEVSVYHNGQLLVKQQSLTHKAITISIDATRTDAHHEFIMVADNLGLIPPNTALMRITAGAQKFELEVSSDFSNNSKIAVDYTGD